MTGQNVPVDKLRIDKWLWAARFFKTRGMASEAVTGGKVHIDGERVKPARPVKVGQLVEVSKGTYRFVVVVDQLIERRGPASVAQTMYTETDDSLRVRQAQQQRISADRIVSRGEREAGRPNKRDRRLLQKIKGKDNSQD